MLRSSFDKDEWVKKYILLDMSGTWEDAEKKFDFTKE